MTCQLEDCGRPDLLTSTGNTINGTQSEHSCVTWCAQRLQHFRRAFITTVEDLAYSNRGYKMLHPSSGSSNVPEGQGRSEHKSDREVWFQSRHRRSESGKAGERGQHVSPEISSGEQKGPISFSQKNLAIMWCALVLPLVLVVMGLIACLTG